MFQPIGRKIGYCSKVEWVVFFFTIITWKFVDGEIFICVNRTLYCELETSVVVEIFRDPLIPSFTFDFVSDVCELRCDPVTSYSNHSFGRIFDYFVVCLLL